MQESSTGCSARTMGAWRFNMPAGMMLKSEPYASDLSAPISPGPARTNFSRPPGVMGLVLGAMQHTPMVKPADQAAGGISWASGWATGSRTTW